MFISIPNDFFVPVIYEYKGKLNLVDEEIQETYRESKDKVESGVQYKNKVITEEETDIKKGEIYGTIDDEYVKEATAVKNKPTNLSCNKGETKEYYNKKVNRNIYDDLDEEYARGFKR